MAEDNGSPKKLSSTATVLLNVQDVNDNPPEFQTDSIEVFVAENVGPGSTLAWIRAEDKDSGILGKPLTFFATT